MKRIVIAIALTNFLILPNSFAERIKLEFNNAMLGTVVDAISQVSRINVIWDKDAIKKKDSLVNIIIQKPVEDIVILNKILLDNGLIMVKDKQTSIYTIKESDEIKTIIPLDVITIAGEEPYKKVIDYIKSVKTDYSILDYNPSIYSIYYKDTKENVEKVKTFLEPYLKYISDTAKNQQELFSKKGKPVTKEYPLSYEDFINIKDRISAELSPFGRVDYDKNKRKLIITDFSDVIQKVIPIISQKLQDKIVTKCFYVRELEPGEIYNNIKFKELSEIGSISFNYKKFDVATIQGASGQPPSVVSVSKPFKIGEFKEDQLFQGQQGQQVQNQQIPPQSQVLRGDYIVSSLPRLCISDYPEVIDKIKYKYYNELLEKPYQIMIEARIVEVSSDSIKDLGIQWGGLASNIDNNNTKVIAGTGSGSSLAAFRPIITNGTNSYGSSYAVDFPANITMPGGFSIGFILGGAQNFLDIRISALQKIGKTKLLSAPKILTTDGETALIRQGYEIPYITGATATTPGNVNFKNAVMQLKVTPFSMADGNIMLNIELSKDEPDFGKAIQGVPPIITKTIINRVSVKDGSTLVIGGIIEKKESEVNTGVPGLMNIPVLGGLFKNNYKNATSSELLIFLSPKIIYE
ncbi:pilus assembly protein PilQ [Sulfurihydrogenibium sp.]|uniref:pilus assembly protein PilQ n=1 Tax=Sulfurihydrogenibium sp. TaxID=2053621 RepID=UPI0026228D05|nr:pilus assembly protein PilQ [Sulfurihydrogenibium sp.]